MLWQVNYRSRQAKLTMFIATAESMGIIMQKWLLATKTIKTGACIYICNQILDIFKKKIPSKCMLTHELLIVSKVNSKNA